MLSFSGNTTKYTVSLKRISYIKSVCLRLLGVTFCALLLTDCGENNETEGKEYPYDTEIDDSLRHGNFDAAMRMIDSQLAISTDSDQYYHYLSRKAGVDYYMACPDSLLIHTGQSLRYYNGMKPTAQRLKDMSTSLQTRSVYYQNYSFNADSARKYMGKATEAARLSGLRAFYSQTLANLGDLQRQFGEFDKAADSYREAALIADSLQLQPTHFVPIYMGLASVYTALYDFYQSEIWWDKSEDLYSHMMETEKFYFLNNRGNDLYLKGDYEGSLKYFKRLRAFLDKHPQMEWESNFCDANISDVLIKLGRGKEALPMISRTLHYFTETQPNPYIRDHILIQQMNQLMDEGKLSEVEQMLRLERNGGERPDKTRDRLEFKQKYYAAVGNWQEAYQACNELKALDDSLRNDRIRLSASEQDKRFSRDRQLRKLRKEVDAKQRHLERIYLWGAIVVLLAAMGGILASIRQRSRETRMLKRIMRLRLEASRNRVTPHFIYNALNSEIAAREDGREGHLDDLVHLLREQQVMADRFLSTLRDEISFADAYISVKSHITAGKVRYEKHIDPDVDLDAVKLPSMTLQIFAENAFKHGFSAINDADKLLVLRVTRAAGRIEISLFNNISAQRDGGGVVESTRVGLRLIMTSLEFLNEGRRHKINFTVEPDAEFEGYHGFEVRIFIPENFNYKNYAD